VPHFADLHWEQGFASLPDAFHQRIMPTPLSHPTLVAFNGDVADQLGLDRTDAEGPGLVAALNGETLPPGTDPVAAIYAGHQFGVWVQQLGDGRAILLGEVVGRNHRRWEVQLKGAGPTRFSRMGDGRAVLRSCVREYLAGEAMHGLGIATTRALAIVGSDTPVYRETTERGAILARVAESHIRFGSFELFASREMDAEVRLLADYVIEHHYPHLLTLPAAQRYAEWFGEVVSRTARLMAAWTATGFVHGVMNTDNMSIVGATLDFGPYGWFDHYDRGYIPNHTDQAGRYAYDQQPRVGLWNCVRLAEALHSLVREADALAALEGYRTTFEREIDERLRAKLGLLQHDQDDVALAADVLGILHDTRADYTRFFRALARYAPGADGHGFDTLAAEVHGEVRLGQWLVRYAERLQREGSRDDDRETRMLRVNPKFVLRNWIAQEAISDAERGEYGTIRVLQELLLTPFDEHAELERYAGGPPAGMAEVVVSCSS
jgi:hypothetical protein